MKYFETIDSAGFKGDVLWIKVIDNPPFVKYNLVFANEISIFLNGQVHILTEVEDKKIGVSFNRINPYMNDFMLSDESLIKFMKNNFAEDFQYYKRALQRIKRDSDYYEKKYHLRDALPMPSKREPESWELTFRDGKLIDKKVTR